MLAQVITEATPITVGLAVIVGAFAASCLTAFAVLRHRVAQNEKRLDRVERETGKLTAWRHREAGAAEAVRRVPTQPYDLTESNQWESR